jgi:hypothetical protein
MEIDRISIVGERYFLAFTNLFLLLGSGLSVGVRILSIDPLKVIIMQCSSVFVDSYIDIK